MRSSSEFFSTKLQKSHLIQEKTQKDTPKKFQFFSFQFKNEPLHTPFFSIITIIYYIYNSNNNNFSKKWKP